MANHNYSQYSNKNHNNHNKQNNMKRNNQNFKPVEKTSVVHETKPEVTAIPEIKLINETVETVSLPETVEGVVVNCAKLNVREKPTVDSDVVCVLNSMSEIEINVNKSTENWFYIYTATGAEGYCMRQYIEAHM